ncbi:MAG: helix-turn-helix transcriptional regulator [Oscillospiraceae bacterium]|nr:helix-turn-helix transcriptional regulator [Oscillospiraceae bacterium]
MINAWYERHSYSLYRNEKIPVICHKDHVSAEKNKGMTYTHWHENPEFLRCRRGKGVVMVAAEVYSFVPDMMVTVNPNDPHSFYHDGPEGMTYDCMIVDANFCRENGLDPGRVRFDVAVRDEKACALYDRAFSSCVQEGPLQVLEARTAVLEFLLYMCRQHPGSPADGAAVSGMEALKKAVIYIRSNYMNAISLQDAAEAAGFSVSYFSREFKKLTGQTFVGFLNMVRCENAAQLLRSGTPVTETCYACGFRELSYFSRAFRQIMGVSPSEILRQRKEGR